MEGAVKYITNNILSYNTGKSSDGFYKYYQILRDTSKDDDESEGYGSTGSGELTGYTEGLHSPFGFIGQIKEKRGYTHNYILWGEPWAIFLMEMADAPRYVRGRRPAPVMESADGIKSILGNRIKKV